MNFIYTFDAVKLVGTLQSFSGVGGLVVQNQNSKRGRREKEEADVQHSTDPAFFHCRHELSNRAGLLLKEFTKVLHWLAQIKFKTKERRRVDVGK